ncbi:MAG: hypothetical protein HY554_04245 [Elusimicrobia bacterium]|nr:hypothetical protein [Elusimicrobiota bacterium]
MLRWVNAAMALAAVAALGVLIAEYGFDLGPGVVESLHAAEAAAAYLFCALQLSKLFLVARPLQLLRRSGFEFALLFLLGFQLLAAAGLEGAPEHAYLSRHGNPAPLAAATVLFVQGYVLAVAGLRSTWLQDALFRLRLHPAQTLLASFVVLIAGGTALLCLPNASAEGRSIGLLDALFTAASAACVTGLSTVDIGSRFSTLGQCVILALIQIGGLGILTLTAAAALVGGRGLGSQAREVGRLLEVETVPQIRRLLMKVLGLTFGIEALGAALLYAPMVSRLDDPFVGGFYAIFHSVSAFCNAGFGLFPDSLAPFRGHSAAMATFSALIVAGGLGAPVLERLPRAVLSALRGRWREIPRHARVVLGASLLLTLGGGACFWLLERGGRLAGSTPEEAFWGSLFLSITARTAGFDVGRTAALGGPSVALLVALMFVGGSPASTAGGVKTTSLAVAWAWLRSRLSGRAPRLAGRPLQAGEEGRVRWVLAGMGGLALGSLLLLALFEGRADGGLLFEAVSALGTVGLSLDVTPTLSAGGKLVIILTMLFGRVGPACLVLTWALRHPDVKTGADPISVG